MFCSHMNNVCFLSGCLESGHTSLERKREGLREPTECPGQKDGWKKERLNLASCCQWLFFFFRFSPVVLHIFHFKDWLSAEVGQIITSDLPLTGSPSCHLIFIYGIIECWSWKGLGNYQCLLFTDVKSLAKKRQVIWPKIPLSVCRSMNEGGSQTSSLLCHKVVSMGTYLRIVEMWLVIGKFPISLIHKIDDTDCYICPGDI